MDFIADYFDCAESHYLVIGDHLAGWSDVFYHLRLVQMD